MRKLFSDTAYTAAAQVLATLLTLGLQVFVVRTTSLEAYGLYAAALSLQMILESVFVSRSGEVALQFVGKAWMEERFGEARRLAREIIRSDFKLYSLLFALIALIAFPLSGPLDIKPWYVVGLALMIPAQSGYGVFKSIFISGNKLKQQAVFDGCLGIFQTAAGMAACYQMGIPGLIGAMVISAGFKNFLAWRLTDRMWPDRVKVIGELPQVQAMAEQRSKFGLHSVLRNAFANLGNNVDILILNMTLGPEKVAIYKVAKTLSSLPVRITSPLWSALRPRIMHAWHTNAKRRLGKLIFLPAAAMLLVLFILALPAWYFLIDWLLAIYGEGYSAAKIPLVFLLVGSWFFNSITAWYGFWIIISELSFFGIMTYAAFFILVLTMGATLGSHSVDRMALAVCLSMIGVSALCWGVFLRELSRLPEGGGA